jgi:hypothetical protein
MWPHPIGHCRSTGLPSAYFTKPLKSHKIEVTPRQLLPSSPTLNHESQPAFTLFVSYCQIFRKALLRDSLLVPLRGPVELSYVPMIPGPHLWVLRSSSSSGTPRLNPTAPRLSCGLEDKSFVCNRQQACQSLGKTYYLQTNLHPPSKPTKSRNKYDRIDEN